MIKHIRFNKITMASAAIMGLCSTPGLASTEGQLTLIGAPGGTMYAVGAEFGGSGKTGFQIRAGGFNYSYKSGDYWEDGSGSIIGAIGRYYSSGAMQGFYVGAGVDLVSGSSSWGGFGYSGSGSFGGIAPSATLGYKLLSGKFAIEPNLTAELIGGHDVGVIVGAGITLGTRF